MSGCDERDFPFKCGSCKVFDKVAAAMVATDVDGNIIDVNQAFCDITGYERSEVLGKNPRIMKSDRHDAGFYASMWNSLTTEGRWQGEIWDRRKNGEVFPKLLAIDALKDAGGRTVQYLGIFSDLSVGKKDLADLERLAHYDPLTGLPNRILFRDRLSQAMGLARRSGRKVAVLFLDLDGFKAVNDGIGHASGDRLLTAVGDRIQLALRQSDTVARFGGDEFTVLLPDADVAGGAAPVAMKILEVLKEPFAVAGRDARVSASIGVAIFPEDGERIDDLLSAADQAMYRAKEAGRNRYEFFSRSMHARAVAKQEMEVDLRHALDREEFVLHYQPQVDPRSGKIVGVEALVRWDRPKIGLIPPARFIPVAEETRLIVPLGEIVIRSACKQARAWRDAGLPPFRIAINVAAAQFEDSKLIDRIATCLIENRIEPKSIELEITESGAMKNPELTLERLHEAKSIGMHVSIDDFGTGYSSLAYLRRFPVDSLKIDRSFMRDVPDDQDNSTLCEAMIALGHSLGLLVVGEGVETRSQLDFLEGHGCDVIQGFLCSRPVPADGIAGMVKSGASLLPASGEAKAHRKITTKRPSVNPSASRKTFPPGSRKR